MALYSFYHDVDLELTWISEHQPLTDTSSYGKSLAGASNLLQKHKVESLLGLHKTHKYILISISLSQIHVSFFFHLGMIRWNLCLLYFSSMTLFILFFFF